MYQELQNINEVLAKSFMARASDGAVRIPTTTLYPSGEVVTLVVERTRSGLFSISDDAGGRDAALNDGVHQFRSSDRKKAEEISCISGARFVGDSFRIDNIDIEFIPSAISIVAECSRSLASYLLDKSSKKKEVALYNFVKSVLSANFNEDSIISKVNVLGASTSQHSFDFGVRLSNDRMALFEIVSLSPQSVAFAHTKFFDVQKSHPNWPREAVVDDVNRWPSDSLSLISQVASHVRSRDTSWDDIALLAA